MINSPIEKIVELVKQRLTRINVAFDDDRDISLMVDLYRQRVSTINDLTDSILYCFQEFDDYEQKAARKALKPESIEALQQLYDNLGELESWDAESIHGVIEKITEKLDVGMGKVGQPLRVAVTGGSFSPPIDQTVELLGRERSISRIKRAIDYIATK
jgi:glutamyl-tRNA synthetase